MRLRLTGAFQQKRNGPLKIKGVTMHRTSWFTRSCIVEIETIDSDAGGYVEHGCRFKKFPEDWTLFMIFDHCLLAVFCSVPLRSQSCKYTALLPAHSSSSITSSDTRKDVRMRLRLVD
jgi:hypothetical protein